MKTEYLIHEYMWSNHCISGNKLGWGITASSMPEDRAYLRELEKLAQAAVIDKTGKTEVDELVYSSVCGFVKMSSVPCESGEDKRQNKRVRIYQPKAPESNPVAYLAPGGNGQRKRVLVIYSRYSLKNRNFIEKISCRR